MSNIKTEYGELIRLKPDMTKLSIDMVCGEIPTTEDSSIVLTFAGAYTGSVSGSGHINVAGDHVSSGKRYKGYVCPENTGAFTWSPAYGPRFHYQDYSSALDTAAANAGMGYAQEMMIHDGKSVKTARPLENSNIYRALCLDSDGDLVLYESAQELTFGDFINALLAQGVKEALYTDMGEGWNYCFYRLDADDGSATYLHDQPKSCASNFIVFKQRPKARILLTNRRNIYAVFTSCLLDKLCLILWG